MIITGDTINGNATITNVEFTPFVAVGLFLYGAGIPIESKIISITATTIVMDKNATVTATGIIITAIGSPVGVFHETNCALADAKMIIDERGRFINIVLRDEGDVDRDAYGSIKRKTRKGITVHTFNSYPVDFDPSKRALEVFGFKEAYQVYIQANASNWEVE